MTGSLDLSTSMTLNDLEPPKEGFLVNLPRFWLPTHISKVNCIEMAKDKPRHLAYEIFSIKRKFQQSKSRTSWVQGGLRTRVSKTATL